MAKRDVILAKNRKKGRKYVQNHLNIEIFNLNNAVEFLNFRKADK